MIAKPLVIVWVGLFIVPFCLIEISTLGLLGSRISLIHYFARSTVGLGS